MWIVFPHIPPSTPSQVLSDLVSRLSSQSTDGQGQKKARIASSKLVRVRDAEGHADYFGLVEPESNEDGQRFLSIARELSRKSGFVIAREFKTRGPTNPFFSAENEWRRPGLEVEEITESNREASALH
jgi:hypothetical protein